MPLSTLGKALEKRKPGDLPVHSDYFLRGIKNGVAKDVISHLKKNYESIEKSNGGYHIMYWQPPCTRNRN